jgi:hypothetical protein
MMTAAMMITSLTPETTTFTTCLATTAVTSTTLILQEIEE